jgi:thymidine kinase
MKKESIKQEGYATLMVQQIQIGGQKSIAMICKKHYLQIYNSIFIYFFY